MRLRYDEDYLYAEFTTFTLEYEYNKFCLVTCLGTMVIVDVDGRYKNVFNVPPRVIPAEAKRRT